MTFKMPDLVDIGSMHTTVVRYRESAGKMPRFASQVLLLNGCVTWCNLLSNFSMPQFPHNNSTLQGCYDSITGYFT